MLQQFCVSGDRGGSHAVGVSGSLVGRSGSRYLVEVLLSCCESFGSPSRAPCTGKERMVAERPAIYQDINHQP